MTPGTLHGTSGGEPVLIGFYGFKGGVGRTLAAAHLAYFYSTMGHRVLLVDADLEAPGLSFWNERSAAQTDDGLVQLLVALHADKLDGKTLIDFIRTEPDFFYWEKEHFPRAMETCEHPIHLMPAGLGGSAGALDIYIESLPKAESAILTVANQLKDALMKSSYDIVLIDSRPGLHSVAAAVFDVLSDFHVVITGPSRQAYQGFLTSLKMLDERQRKNTVFAMSPTPWQAAGRLEDLQTAVKQSLGGEREALPRVVPISWHPQLAIEERLITAVDPTSATARDYQTLFVELETLRGFGIDQYTESVDALLDIFKSSIDTRPEGMKHVKDAFDRDSQNEPSLFEQAFPDLTQPHIERIKVCLVLDDHDSWKSWSTRVGFVQLIIWEIVRRLRELVRLDRDAAESLWGIVVRRNYGGRYKTQLEGSDAAAASSLGRVLMVLNDEYERQFNRRLENLKFERTSTGTEDRPEITVEMFTAMFAGGQA